MNPQANDTFVTVQIPARVYADLLSLETDELKEAPEIIRRLAEDARRHDARAAEKRQGGLVSAIGKWEGFEEIETVLSDLQSIREGGGTGTVEQFFKLFKTI
ncbi:hypothetical protein QUF80_07410 [Desulfococcaceae bacterium HSG8]|nr:hypothetical protein [Desulfococcaceae bacterium HSG8]